MHGKGRTLLARGNVFEVATVLHSTDLLDNLVKVTIHEVFILDALVCMPTDEVNIVAHVF